MKRESIINIILLALFIVLVILGGDVAQQIVYLLGCFAIGWQIPNAARTIDSLFTRKGS